MQFYVRTIVRNAELFDGTTPETATGYTPGVFESNRGYRFFKSTPDAAVGAFSTRNLSSVDGERPLVVWYKLIGEPQPNSRVEIRSAFAGDAEAGYQPTNTLLQTLPLRTTQTQVILGPTDRFCVFHERPGTVEAQVLDLFDALAAGLVTPPAASDGCCQFDELVVTEPTELAPWVGTLVVRVTMDLAGGQLVLPALADLDVTARLFVVRDGGEWFSVRSSDPGDTINESLDTIIFSDDHYGVWFHGGGKSRNYAATHSTRQYEAFSPVNPGLGLPIVINPYPSGSVFNLTNSDPAVRAKEVRLPPTALQAPGSWAVFSLAADSNPCELRLSDPAEEFIDLVLGGAVGMVNPGDTVVVFRDGGSGYRTVHNIHDQGALRLRDLTNVNIVVSQNHRGSRFVTLGAIGIQPQELRLPDPAAAPPAEEGQEWWVRSLIDGATVKAFGALTFVGGGALPSNTLTVDADEVVCIRWDGTEYVYVGK